MNPVLKLIIEVSRNRDYLYRSILRPSLCKALESVGLKEKDFALEDVAEDVRVITEAGVLAGKQFVESYKWMNGRVSETLSSSAQPTILRIDVYQTLSDDHRDSYLSTQTPIWLSRAVNTHCLEAMHKSSIEHAKRLVADWMYKQANKRS